MIETGLTKNFIVEELYKDNFIQSICKKYSNSKYIYDELLQELSLILLNFDEEKLINYYTGNCLNYIIVGILRNQVISSSSSFFRKFKRNNNNENIKIEKFNNKEQINFQEELLKNEEFYSIVKKYLEKIEEKDTTIETWYEHELFRIYYGLSNTQQLPKSHRQIQRETKIPYCNVYSTVKKVMNKIKNDLKIEIRNFKKNKLI